MRPIPRARGYRHWLIILISLVHWRITHIREPFGCGRKGRLKFSDGLQKTLIPLFKFRRLFLNIEKLVICNKRAVVQISLEFLPIAICYCRLDKGIFGIIPVQIVDFFARRQINVLLPGEKIINFHCLALPCSTLISSLVMKFTPF